jgi:hypothetical protein
VLCSKSYPPKKKKEGRGKPYVDKNYEFAPDPFLSDLSSNTDGAKDVCSDKKIYANRLSGWIAFLSNQMGLVFRAVDRRESGNCKETRCFNEPEIQRRDGNRSHSLFSENPNRNSKEWSAVNHAQTALPTLTVKGTCRMRE